MLMKSASGKPLDGSWTGRTYGTLHLRTASDTTPFHSLVNCAENSSNIRLNTVQMPFSWKDDRVILGVVETAC